MAFWGSTFLFDGVPSETYNLYISSTDDGEGTSPLANVELYTESIFRRPKVYLYGVQQTPVLQFSVKISSPDEIDAVTAQIIQRWLFGRMQYKQLMIIQNDMTDIYFNCILQNPQIVRNGNIITGFTCDVVCDSPYGWETEKTITYTFGQGGGVIVSDQIFVNLSDNPSYLYPTLTITMNSVGGNLTITNTDDNSRLFTFTGLSANEVVTVNNDFNTISSSTGLLRISNFNKKWFRLVPGVNRLNFNGAVYSTGITYQFARKIGG